MLQTDNQAVVVAARQAVIQLAVPGRRGHVSLEERVAAAEFILHHILDMQGFLTVGPEVMGGQQGDITVEAALVIQEAAVLFRVGPVQAD
jgi:hypothetical protein